jgi:SAM-dependent methyltransferase
MQTRAELWLIKILADILKSGDGPFALINLGAARSTVVEEALWRERKNFICDRADIQPCEATGEFVGACFICPLENLQPVKDNSYDAAFANFVLEHVSDPVAAAREMTRILKPGGSLVLSLSNPRAPEFRLAKITSVAFHQLFRKKGHDQAYPVQYAYGSVDNLIRLLESAGLELTEEKHFSSSYAYLENIPLLGFFGQLYDKFIEKLQAKEVMGHAVISFKKSVDRKI